MDVPRPQLCVNLTATQLLINRGIVIYSTLKILSDKQEQIIGPDFLFPDSGEMPIIGKVKLKTSNSKT